MAKQSSFIFDPFQLLGQNRASETPSKAVLRPVEKFWEGQKQILGEYEKLTAAMLERRRAGTEAALDAVHKMQQCKDPAEWASCCNEWLGGSFARLANDGMDPMNESFKVWTEFSHSMNAGISSAMAPVQARESEAHKGSMRHPKH